MLFICVHLCMFCHEEAKISSRCQKVCIPPLLIKSISKKYIDISIKIIGTEYLLRMIIQNKNV